MNSKVIFSLFFTLFILFILSSCPVAPLPSESENVLINEFELNPEGTDHCYCTEEWVELYNPTSVDINIGGWTLNTSQGRSVTIEEGTVIAAHGFYVIIRNRWEVNGVYDEWLFNENEFIILTGADEREIDRTPLMSDPYDNASTWSRVPDGQDNWVFQPSTKGGFNTNQPPKADFSFDPLNPKWGENVQFTDNSQDIDGYIIEWLWDFGDGQTSNETNPNHSYAHGGLYVVNLTVEDNGTATDKIWKSLVVTENATQLEKPDWTPYILGGTTMGVVLGSVILMVKYRKKKKAQQSNASLLERNQPPF